VSVVETTNIVEAHDRSDILATHQAETPPTDTWRDFIRIAVKVKGINSDLHPISLSLECFPISETIFSTSSVDYLGGDDDGYRNEYLL
jgi:hypothetical protein